MKLETLIELAEIGLKHAPLSCLGDLSMGEIEDSRFAIDGFKEHGHIDLDHMLFDSDINRTKEVTVGLGKVITLHPEEIDVFDGRSEPIMLGYHDGVVELAIWNDVQEDPIHVIQLIPTMEMEEKS